MTIWHIVAYLAGFFTLPAVLVVMAVPDWIGTRGWRTHALACRHGGPNTQARAPGDAGPRPRWWQWSWRCTVIVDDAAKLVDFAECRCCGRWVRGWVARLVPNRVLWPQAVRLAARREGDDA